MKLEDLIAEAEQEEEDRIRYLMRGNSKGSEGETIETKVARIVQNKEPITDGAPMIYTEKNQIS